MVFAQSLSASNDENVSVNPSISRRRHNTIARRQRYRFQNTSLAPSRRHATREAARRISHSTPIVHHPRMMQDVDMDDEPPVQASTQRNASLPRHLRRPAFRGIAHTAISAVEPDLKDVAIGFIQQKLHAQGERMFYAANHTVFKCPKSRLPRELEAVINDVSASPPTHLFAVYSQPSALQKQRISLYPAHALILAANCANLPPLPYSKPDTPDYPGDHISLPVVPLAIQSPETFPILLEYLYTQSSENFLRSLLPLDPREDIPPPDHLARQLSTMCSSMTLRTHLYRIHGLWTNVTALGVFDEKLWRTMEAAWEVLQIALA